LGWLVGIGALAIRRRTFIAAGPIMAALSGVAIGAAAGGMPAPDRDGHSRTRSQTVRGQSQVRQHSYLRAHDDSEEIARVKEIFTDARTETSARWRGECAQSAQGNDRVTERAAAEASRHR